MFKVEKICNITLRYMLMCSNDYVIQMLTHTQPHICAEISTNLKLPGKLSQNFHDEKPMFFGEIILKPAIK